MLLISTYQKNVISKLLFVKMTLPKLTLKYTVSAIISINLGTVLIMNTFNIITKVDQTTPSYFSYLYLAPKEYAIVIFGGGKEETQIGVDAPDGPSV